MSDLSPALARMLLTIARGKDAQYAAFRESPSLCVLAGILEQRGYVRTVKHRDHTRSYKLTGLGDQALTDAEIDRAFANAAGIATEVRESLSTGGVKLKGQGGR